MCLSLTSEGGKLEQRPQLEEWGAAHWQWAEWLFISSLVIFHLSFFCNSQYIVETFPRFTISSDYLPPLSTFPFLVSWMLLEEEDKNSLAQNILAFIPFFLGHSVFEQD